MTTKKIVWHGYFKKMIEDFPNESAAFLFSDHPYTENETWHTFPVKNCSKCPKYEWIPEKKDKARIKRLAKKMELVKIGNFHTHCVTDEMIKRDEFKGLTKEHLAKYQCSPSDSDLLYAKRFRDIVRGIYVIKDKIHWGFMFHDMFGKKIEVTLLAISEKEWKKQKVKK